jgi:hypothetical protein
VTFLVGTGAPGGTVCGTVPALAVSPGDRTNASGQAVVNYTQAAGSTEGFCPITATETTTHAAATAYVTQTNPTSTVNTLDLTASPNPIPANGATYATLLSAEAIGASNSAIDLDPVQFAFSGDCGTPATGVVEYGTTGAAGAVAVAPYIASTTAGTCTVTATEAYGGATNTVTITQGPVVYSVVVAATPPTITGNGLITSSVTATVTNTFGTPAVTDSVAFVVTAPNGTTVCGTLSAASAITNASGVATVSYNSSPDAGFCTITATEATTTGSGSTQIDQTSV